MIYMLLKGFCMMWEIYQGAFNTFTKVRRRGQYPGRLLGVRVIFMSLLFYMFQSIFLHFFSGEKLIIFMDGGNPPPH